MIDPTDPRRHYGWSDDDDVYDRIKKQQRRRAFRTKALICTLGVLSFVAGILIGWYWI